MSIRKSIVWPVTILATCLLCIAALVGALFNWSIQRQIVANEDISELTLLISDVNSGVLTAEIFVQSAFLGTVQFDRDTTLAKFERYISEVNADMQAILEMGQHSALTDAIYDLISSYGNWYRETKTVLNNGQPATQNNLIENNGLLGEITEKTRKISFLAREMTREQIQEIRQRNKMLSLLSLAIASLLSGLAITYAVKTASSLTFNLQAALGRIISMSEDVDPAPAPVNDNFEELLQAIHVLEAAMLEKKRMSQHLLEAKKKAEEATKAKSRFLATMTHELRTPISGVIGLAELLSGTKINPDQRFYVSSIQSSSEDLLQIVNDLLDFSAIEASQIALTSKVFCLKALVSSVSNLLQPKFEQNGIKLLIDIPGDVPDLFIGDAGRLRQILINLTGNAIKFTPEGHVVIAVRYSQNEMRPLTISVQDTGIGIEETQRDRIFEAFQQVQDDLNRNFEGTGLGLAITSRLVEMMGGTISVSSQLNVGSQFTVSLDLPTEPALTKRDAISSYKSVQSSTIAFVSNDPLAQALFERDFIPFAAQINTTDRLTGFFWEQDTSPDIVVLDYPFDRDTPVTSGLSICDQLWSNSTQEKVPVIFLSELKTMAALNDLQNHGPVKILPKPLRQELLLQEISALLQEKAPNDASCSEQTDTKLAIYYTDVIPKILIAEDNKTNQFVLRKLLEPTGANLSFCGDGLEAVKVFREQPFNLVLMDVSMPGLDGLSATKEIRAFEAENRREECPIIAITANASKTDQEKCLAAGMSCALAKPVRKQELYNALARWIPRAPLHSKPYSERN
ncbi:response regulator [Parasedimentitalea marina]|uniref:histidine kinase n=1 Tax=Parasedimentitalea marina TaxID=2483033 RepID=A0A3T0N3U7_9RHOB|nr:response regulator [Parasedimentitalea marina]AZV78706.1 response regulator [Parasedimentitalea marina]